MRWEGRTAGGPPHYAAHLCAVTGHFRDGQKDFVCAPHLSRMTIDDVRSEGATARGES